MINGKPIRWKNWHDQGGLNSIESVVAPDGAFVPYDDLAQKYLVDHWSQISLLDGIPKDQKNVLRSTSTHEQITIDTQTENNNITVGQ